MHLIIGSTPDSDWDRILPLLAQAGWAMAASGHLELYQAAAGRSALTTDAAGLRQAGAELLAGCPPSAVIPVDAAGCDGTAAFWLQEFAETRLLFLYSRPDMSLVRAMLAGREPTRELDQWQAAAERMLRAFRRNRRRVFLVDIDRALAAPASFLGICATWADRNQGSAPDCPRTESAGAEAGIHHLLAARMVAQSPRIGELVAELEAASQPLGEPPAPGFFDCLKIFRDHREHSQQLEQFRQAHQAIEAAQKESREENELLLLQLHQVQEELETRFLQEQEALKRLGAAEKETGLLASRLEQEQEKSSQLSKARDKAVKEAAALESRIGKLTEERGKSAKLAAEHLAQLKQEQEKSSQLSKARDKAVKEAAALEGRIGNLTGERENSDKLAAEHLAQLEQLRRQHQDLEATHKEGTEENELLLLQLHQVQEELESYFLQLQEKRDKLVKAENKVAMLESKLKGEQKKSARWEGKVQRMKNSKSWKITAPIRAVTKPFKKQPNKQAVAS